MIESETRDRLQIRAKKDDETYDDVIHRLLNETAVEVDLEELVRTATEQYESVPQVAIEHFSLTCPAEPSVLVWGATCIEEDLEVVPPEATVSLPRGDETVNYPCLLAAVGGSLRQGLPVSTTCFADTTAVSTGSAVSTGVPSE